MRCTSRNGIILFLSLVTFLDVDPVSMLTNGSPILEAMARVGQPLTPVSVAGVARRTTRRTFGRSAIYINALPLGCAQVTGNGTVVLRCGGTCYQPSGSTYVVIYVD